jgi:hypothetical protein
MLFKEIIPVYTENHMKPTSRLYGQNVELLIVKAGGTYTYHLALKVKLCVCMCRKLFNDGNSKVVNDLYQLHQIKKKIPLSSKYVKR